MDDRQFSKLSQAVFRDNDRLGVLMVQREFRINHEDGIRFWTTLRSPDKMAVLTALKEGIDRSRPEVQWARDRIQVLFNEFLKHRLERMFA